LLLFHGGDTGSTPVRDAKFAENFHDLREYEAGDAFLNGLCWTSAGVWLNRRSAAQGGEGIGNRFLTLFAIVEEGIPECEYRIG
jgi:hypothetical protein